MSNPHSPEPARWILEMFAPDIPAWNRAFNELERKPLSALEDMLVHSFDRYLRRKGYLTKEQVEVLEGIARKHNVLLPPIPPIARHTESSHTKQELTPRSALFQQIKNPLELEEAEVVRHEVLARWRTFLPEKAIQTLLEHRRLIREWRQKVGWTRVPDFAYPMPRQPEIERKPEVFAMGIDTEGWILPRHRYGENKINKYARYYERPEIGFETDNLQLTMKLANMMLTTIRPRPPRPPRVLSPMFQTIAGSSRAVHATIHAHPYFIKWKTQAEEILKIYRARPMKRLH